MQLPKLTPLQSRFAASFAASLLLLILYLAFSNPHFAYAENADTITHDDHNHPLILDRFLEDEIRYQDEQDAATDRARTYEPEFPSMGRSILGRAPAPSTVQLANNIPAVMSIAPADTQCFIFPQTALDQPPSLVTQALPPNRVEIVTGHAIDDHDMGYTGSELRRRQRSDHLLYLTLSVCGQPSSAISNPKGPPPPLELYISQAMNDECPGPNFAGQQGWLTADGGFTNYTNPTSGDSYFTVSAPQAQGFNGNYTYELTASIDAPFTYYEELPGLFFVDSDQNSSFFMTNNLTTSNSSTQQDEWMQTGAPFTMFMHDANDVMITGLLRSYCGLNTSAQIRTMADVEVGMTTIAGGLPKQQYYVKGLNKTTSYHAVMALPSNYTQTGVGMPGGGGVVWQDILMTTKTGKNLYSASLLHASSLRSVDPNCQLIYNLSFCDTVNYAVPANPTNNSFASMVKLAAFYDNYTSQNFNYFAYSLEQIPCNTTAEAQYSLATNCSNCYNAYKQWLCAVTIPRCMDFSSTEPYLQARNVNQSFIDGSPFPVGDPTFSEANKSVMYLNSSRVRRIDQIIQPGPYKELLPCIGLCYDLVQNCPAALGFACPLAGKGQNYSYGYVTNNSLTCNIPGAIWGVNGASGYGPSIVSVWLGLSLAIVVSMTGA
ncbi:stretch-activated cation channel mid1 [Xylographa pallens]|nr:stretch-activated cation channel mid1 [Xylographa pallens]